MASSLPQAFDKVTTLRFHLTFFVALLPVAITAVWLHGWPVAVILVLSTGTAVGLDQLVRVWQGDRRAWDGGALLWGLLLGLLLPANSPFYLPILGSGFAILVVKALLGGGGIPWINPVLASWAFLQTSFPLAFPRAATVSFDRPSGLDAQVAEWLNTNVFSWLSIQLPGGYVDLVLGLGRPEAALIGEAGTVFLLLATVVLLAKGFFPWQVPAFFFLAFSLPMMAVGGNLLVQVFSGSLLLNMFFLASDPSSRPLSPWAWVVYALGAGCLSFLVRFWGMGPDAVGYAVLFMNLLVPWLDRSLRSKTLNDFHLA